MYPQCIGVAMVMATKRCALTNLIPMSQRDLREDLGPLAREDRTTSVNVATLFRKTNHSTPTLTTAPRGGTGGHRPPSPLDRPQFVRPLIRSLASDRHRPLTHHYRETC